jgi:hypothetical protein
MKTALFLLICSLPSIACVVGAIILALNGIAGWGWFLFIAATISSVFTDFTELKIKN